MHKQKKEEGGDGCAWLANETKSGRASVVHRPDACTRLPPVAASQRMTTSTHAMVVGTTHRYRSKYVTTVM